MCFSSTTLLKGRKSATCQKISSKGSDCVKEYLISHSNLKYKPKDFQSSTKSDPLKKASLKIDRIRVLQRVGKKISSNMENLHSTSQKSWRKVNMVPHSYPPFRWASTTNTQSSSQPNSMGKLCWELIRTHPTGRLFYWE